MIRERAPEEAARPRGRTQAARRRLTLGGRFAAAATVALLAVCIGMGNDREARAMTARPASCPVPGVYFQKVRYERKRLAISFLRVGRLIGAAPVVGGPCCDVMPCPPPSPAPPPLRVYGLVGIAPRTALSVGGSSRAILVASDRCKKRLREQALLRCLRHFAS
jgi:hypothetical protein